MGGKRKQPEAGAGAGGPGPRRSGRPRRAVLDLRRQEAAAQEFLAPAPRASVSYAPEADLDPAFVAPRALDLPVGPRAPRRDKRGGLVFADEPTFRPRLTCVRAGKGEGNARGHGG